MEISEKEIYRYLGYHGADPTAEVARRVEQCAGQLLAVIEPRFVFRRLPVLSRHQPVLSRRPPVLFRRPPVSFRRLPVYRRYPSRFLRLYRVQHWYCCFRLPNPEFRLPEPVSESE